MKKQGLIFGSIGAVVLLIIVSMNSVIAFPSENQEKTNQTASQIITDEKVSEVPYIDPSIHLTRKHLPILKRALTQMGDDTRKDLIQNIISCLEKQGSVTSKDVQQIVKESNSGIKAIHFMKRLFGRGPGESICFPFTILHTQWAIFLLLLPAFIPTCMGWKVEYNQDSGGPPADSPTSVEVGLFYEYDQHTHTGGLAIGFIGLAFTSLSGNLMHNYWSNFLFSGFGLIIIIV